MVVVVAFQNRVPNAMVEAPKDETSSDKIDPITALQDSIGKN